MSRSHLYSGFGWLYLFLFWSIGFLWVHIQTVCHLSKYLSPFWLAYYCSIIFFQCSSFVVLQWFVHNFVCVGGGWVRGGEVSYDLDRLLIHRNNMVTLMHQQWSYRSDCWATQMSLYSIYTVHPRYISWVYCILCKLIMAQYKIHTQICALSWFGIGEVLPVSRVPTGPYFLENPYLIMGP